jgi:hypothetical protein
MKKRHVLVFAVGALGAFALARSGRGQVQKEFSTLSPSVQYVEPVPRGGIFRADSKLRATSRAAEVRRLVDQLRETEDDAKKADLTKQLQAAVSNYFDDDLKARETELAKLEERLRKLRTQLDRRRKAKSEIIDLQLKVLINEAEGLGFSGALFPARGTAFGGMGDMMGAGMAPAGSGPYLIEAEFPAPAAGPFETEPALPPVNRTRN